MWLQTKPPILRYEVVLQIYRTYDNFYLLYTLFYVLYNQYIVYKLLINPWRFTSMGDNILLLLLLLLHDW